MSKPRELDRYRSFGLSYRFISDISIDALRMELSFQEEEFADIYQSPSGLVIQIYGRTQPIEIDNLLSFIGLAKDYYISQISN